MSALKRQLLYCYTTLNIALKSTKLHSTALRSTALHCTALHYTTVKCTSPLRADGTSKYSSAHLYSVAIFAFWMNLFAPLVKYMVFLIKTTKHTICYFCGFLFYSILVYVVFIFNHYIIWWTFWDQLPANENTCEIVKAWCHFLVEGAGVKVEANTLVTGLYTGLHSAVLYCTVLYCTVHWTAQCTGHQSTLQCMAAQGRAVHSEIQCTG